MAACLGVPMVASREIETHRTLFPHTTVPWHDVAGAVAAARRLLDDPAFAEQVRTEARRQVDYYDVAAARGRITAALARVAERRRYREGA
jgi:hypothetical protein